MRFAFAHKLTTYFMASFAYGALILSDELGPLTVTLSLAGFVVSWFWEAPRVRPDRWTPWWNALAILFIGVTIVSVLAGQNAVVSFSRFLLLLLIAKLFTRSSSRDYLWACVLSFSLLVAASSLNGGISYAFCFLGFVVSSTWALILLHLRRDMEENLLLRHATPAAGSQPVETSRVLSSRRVVGPTFLFGTGVASMVIFLSATVLFFLIPRLGFGLFLQKSRSDQNMAGFSDGVQLGGHGLIRDDSTVVMRVYLTDPRFTGEHAAPLHWRGVAFDRYENGSWSRSYQAPRTRHYREPVAAGVRVLLPMGDARRRKGDLQDAVPGALRQEIYLDNLGTSALFAASRPVALDIDARDLGGFIGVNDEVRYPHPAGIRYLAYAEPDPVPADRLRLVGDVAFPERFATYLQIPDEVPRSVRDLAAEITRDARGPYAKAAAVEGWLKENFQYTLEQRTDPSREPLEYFLFERRMGHCEYFSSAMALLLRAVGVPTRNVNGFYGGEWNEYGGYLAVRGGDAHSWVEVWFDGYGWITFDPTPAAARSYAQSSGGILDAMRRMLDTVKLQWFKWFIEYDRGRQFSVFKKLGSFFQSGSSATRRAGEGLASWAKKNRWLLAGLAGAVALVVLALGLRNRRRAHGPRRRKAAATASHPVVVLYARTSTLLARRGFARPAGRTPREHADLLRSRAAPGSAPFDRLTELYYAARFGQGAALAPAVDLDEARRLAASVKTELSARH